MSSKLIPPWLSDHFEFGSGFISSWLWIELALLSLCTMLLLKLFFPLFKGYRLGSKLNSLFGTDEHRHWFYGHTRKVGRVRGSVFQVFALDKKYSTKALSIIDFPKNCRFEFDSLRCAFRSYPLHVKNILYLYCFCAGLVTSLTLFYMGGGRFCSALVFFCDKSLQKQAFFFKSN